MHENNEVIYKHRFFFKCEKKKAESLARKLPRQKKYEESYVKLRCGAIFTNPFTVEQAIPAK